MRNPRPPWDAFEMTRISELLTAYTFLLAAADELGVIVRSNEEVERAERVDTFAPVLPDWFIRDAFDDDDVGGRPARLTMLFAQIRCLCTLELPDASTIFSETPLFERRRPQPETPADLETCRLRSARGVRFLDRQECGSGLSTAGGSQLPQTNRAAPFAAPIAEIPEDRSRL
jgi:hypothetical protein